METIQSNTKQGLFHVNAGENLTGKEGYLVKAADAGSVLEVLLPTDVADITPYIVEEGATLDSNCVVRPLIQGEQVRFVAKGTGSAGALLTHAAPATAADKGKLRTVPATADTYCIIAIAEEDFVDGQYVKARVHFREVVVS
jgi:fructose-specific component phosphotransferase system IIB-like protein